MCCGGTKYATKTHDHSKYALLSDLLEVQGDLTQAQADIVALQDQVDLLEQLVEDCGCGCVPWSEEFESDLGIATIPAPCDWEFNYSAASQRLRIVRENGAQHASGITEFDIPDTKVLAGMTYDVSTRNDNNIDHCDFRMDYTDPQGNPQYNVTVYTDSSPSGADVPVSIDFTQTVPIGSTITKLRFYALTIDGAGTSYARWYLNYVRLVCPA